MKSNKIVYPDYNNCVLNLITSILRNYNVPTNHKSLSCLDSVLSHKFKNIVFIILDGMGDNLLSDVSQNGFFSKNKFSTITSICPSTTTAVLNAFYSGKFPIETGWIAWSQYFKEYGRCLDMFPKTDSYTGVSYDKEKFNVYDLIKYKSVYEQIEESSPDIKAYEINPTHCDSISNRSFKANDVKTMCEDIVSLCNNNEKKYIFAYSDSPDKILHKEGCKSPKVKNFILESESLIESMCLKLQNTDTLVIVSADHGHNDIDVIYNATELKEINECLIMPPSLESRFVGFWVKEDRKKDFERIFNEKFKNEFILLTKEELLDRHLLGEGTQHPKVDDFLGNYIAISISNSIIKLGSNLSPEKPDKLSTHCGLTENEMLVPLIVYKC